MIWRCDKCGFVGDFMDFALEANRRNAGNQSPDIDMSKIDEIPYEL